MNLDFVVVVFWWMIMLIVRHLCSFSPLVRVLIMQMGIFANR